MNHLQIGLVIFGQFLLAVLLVWLLLSAERPKPKPAPVPSPADVAALMDEARRITG